ncbi:MAG: protein kinase [Myxococcota bacterium]
MSHELNNKVGAYTLEAELGRGGMGVVQLARHPKHGLVALKRLSETPRAFALQSLRSEIALLSRLDHSGVVKLIDHGMEERGPWMAMELIAGQSLAAFFDPGLRPTETQWTQNVARSVETTAAQTDGPILAEGRATPTPTPTPTRSTRIKGKKPPPS